MMSLFKGWVPARFFSENPKSCRTRGWALPRNCMVNFLLCHASQISVNCSRMESSFYHIVSLDTILWKFKPSEICCALAGGLLHFLVATSPHDWGRRQYREWEERGNRFATSFRGPNCFMSLVLVLQCQAQSRGAVTVLGQFSTMITCVVIY